MLFLSNHSDSSAILTLFDLSAPISSGQNSLLHLIHHCQFSFYGYFPTLLYFYAVLWHAYPLCCRIFGYRVVCAPLTTSLSTVYMVLLKSTIHNDTARLTQYIKMHIQNLVLFHHNNIAMLQYLDIFSYLSLLRSYIFYDAFVSLSPNKRNILYATL